MKRHWKNFINNTFRVKQRDNLLNNLKPFLPKQSCNLLDIGAADGHFSLMLKTKYPNLNITCVEVIKRDIQHLPIIYYDGEKLPFEAKSFDLTILINVLHHTPCPKELLKEAIRVSKNAVIIKDHYANNIFDKITLFIMEHLNPNSKMLLKRGLIFYSKKQWQNVFNELNLKCDLKLEKFESYGRFWDIFFGRKMHFIGKYSAK